MKEICIIYNFDQKYREGIYSLIERHYSCHWVFGKNETDIKGIENGVLNDVKRVKNKTFGPLYYQEGVPALLDRYDCILMLGELFCVSTWMMLLKKKTFCREKKIYLWSHGWYGREGFLKKWLKKWFFGMADSVFLYGQYAKDVAIKQGYKKNNLIVIHNSLDYEKQLKLRQSNLRSGIYEEHFHNDAPVLLFIGRLTKVKHLDLLIEAVASLREKGYKYNLVFVGDGEEREHLENLVNNRSLTDVTWFYGSCYSEEQNAPLIFNADLCVSPGNVGLTAMHSMVYGTPVLTHNDFAFQMPEFEAIHPMRTGNFFKRDDVEALTLAIMNWFGAPDYDRQKIRQACYDEIDAEWTPTFQFDKITKTIQ